MKVTCEQIVAANEAIRKLMSNGNATASVSSLTAYRLARVARVVGQEAEAFDVGRLALIKELVPEPNEHGMRVVPPELAEEFSDGYKLLAKQEVDVTVQLLDLADFGDTKIGLTAFVGMEWLFNDKQGKPKRKARRKR